MNNQTNFPFYIKKDELKPIIKWNGAKRWLAPYLNEIYKNYKNCRMVEPFCGSLSISLKCQPEKALLNDINPCLISFYKWIKSGLIINIPLYHSKDLFSHYKKLYNEMIKNNQYDCKNGASMFYYLASTCYGGIRFNNKKMISSPFGYRVRKFFSKDFYQYELLFNNWDFENKDFEDLYIQNNDFVYIDPPYYNVGFSKYYEKNFTLQDHIRLCSWISKYDVPTIISNEYSNEIIELYKNYNFEFILIKGKRSIGTRFGDRVHKEILAYKNIKNFDTAIFKNILF